MTDKPNEPASHTAGHRPGDGRYLALVAGLLIIIIGVLAALWQRERSAASEAMRKLSQLRGELSQLRGEQQRLQLANRIMTSEQVGRVRPLARHEWTLGEVTVNGRPRQVFFLDANAARRFGLAVGDVAIVRSGSDANAPGASSGPSGG